MKVDDLITEMLKVKAQYPNLERTEILKIFEIAAMQGLIEQLRRIN